MAEISGGLVRYFICIQSIPAPQYKEARGLLENASRLMDSLERISYTISPGLCGYAFHKNGIYILLFSMRGF
jgi:hypothetical protein